MAGRGVPDNPRLGTGPAADASRSHRQRASTPFGPARFLSMSMAGKGLIRMREPG